MLFHLMNLLMKTNPPIQWWRTRSEVQRSHQNQISLQFAVGWKCERKHIIKELEKPCGSLSIHVCVCVCGQDPVLEPTSDIECGKGDGKQKKIEENRKRRIDVN